ncbi:MAG: hypothetical protein JNK04_04475 [Myxococcales bacterium]|nr:hypothetical protein [Myxococcales bacterium]
MVLAAFAAAGCEGKPLPPMSMHPSGSTASGSMPSESAARVPSAASATPSASSPPVEAPSTASAAVAPAAVDLASAPALTDSDGKPLKQTEDRPKADSAAFNARMALLWKAIVSDDPAVAEPAFFPVVAYEQVKDIEKPAVDWKSRLLKAFGRNIHGYHEKLGAEPDKAVLLGVDIDDDRVKWMAPGKEGNKVGYYRVTRNRIRYKDAGGKERKLELTSLISWRGEWFVVHLDGFK